MIYQKLYSEFSENIRKLDFNPNISSFRSTLCKYYFWFKLDNMANVKIVKIAKIAIVLLALYYTERWIYEMNKDQRESTGDNSANDDIDKSNKENRLVKSVDREHVINKPKKPTIIKTIEVVNRTEPHEDLNSHVYLDRYKTHVCLIKKNMLTVMMVCDIFFTVCIELCRPSYAISMIRRSTCKCLKEIHGSVD